MAVSRRITALSLCISLSLFLWPVSFLADVSVAGGSKTLISEPSGPSLQVDTKSSQPESAPANAETAAQAPAVAMTAGVWSDYPIHAGDKIKIIVRNEQELSDTYLVEANGDIHFPLV